MFAASTAKKSVSQLEDGVEHIGILAAADEAAYLSLLAALRFTKAAKTAHDGRAWSRLERYILASSQDYHRSLSSEHAPSDAILVSLGISKDLLVRRIADIYKQKDVAMAAHLVTDLMEEAREIRRLVRDEEQASRRAAQRKTPFPILPPFVAAAQKEALEQAKAAREVLERAKLQIALVAAKSSAWWNMFGIPEAKEAAAAALFAESCVARSMDMFQTACDNLEDATTDPKFAAACLDVIKAKEGLLGPARAAHFAFQKAALAIHQGGKFEQIAKAEGGGKPTRGSTAPDYIFEIEAALKTAVDAKALNDELVRRALQDLKKLPRNEPKVIVTETRLHEEAAVAEAFVQHIKDLLGEGTRQLGQNGGLLATEARSCADHIWQSVLNVDTLIYDMQNNLDMLSIVRTSP